MKQSLSSLPALKMLLTEKNISRSAEKMNLSQSAMSRLFARLKLEFDDPLMVRTGTQYQLTPRAQVLLQQLNQLLPQIDSLWHNNDVVLSEVEQTLVISGTDMDIVHISNKLNIIRSQAPKLQFAIRTSSPRVVDEVLRAEVDFALTAFEDQRAGLYRKLITEETFVVVAGKNCPLQAGELDLKTYLDYKHGKFSFAESTRGCVDAALESQGVQRKISLSLPTFLQIPSFLEDPELLFSVPASFASYLKQHFDIKILPLPFSTRRLPIYLYWHERLHQNPLHKWVRDSL
jgi:DNA-binding transcriptional LysR family regulator